MLNSFNFLVKAALLNYEIISFDNMSNDYNIYIIHCDKNASFFSIVTNLALFNFYYY